MIKLENIEVVGWEAAIRGMRNPLNSWDRSDSIFTNSDLDEYHTICGDSGPLNFQEGFCLGENDVKLMNQLAAGGPVHAKYRRMIQAYVDITAPLYWWKEMDTYKVGTVANSCSTMHKIHERYLTLDDFSHEHLLGSALTDLMNTIYEINKWRDIFNNGGSCIDNGKELVFEPNDKRAWWQMIQLLPSSYNQKRTWMANYEVLTNIYHSRKNHKLDEWREFCKWIETLPYSEIITGGKSE